MVALYRITVLRSGKMGQGIYIDLNDGRPAMQITSGLRAPSWCGGIQANGVDSSNTTVDFSLQMSPGSSAFCLPSQAIYVDDMDFIPEVYYMNSFQKVNDSVGRITIGNFNGKGGRKLNFSGNCYEILPPNTGNQGILVSDSTDFASIPNNARLMSAAFVGGVQVNGQAQLPVAGIPFGMWDNPNVTLESDGNTIWCRDANYNGIDDVAGSTYVQLVIFNNTPPPAGPGITMSNPSGQIVFSSVRRPFVFAGNIGINDNWQSCGGFFPILRTGTICRVVGGYNNIRYKGVCMSGGSVRSAPGTRVGNYSTQSGAQFPFNINISMPIPFTPNMY